MALERGGMQAIGVSLHANLTHAERLTLLQSASGLVSIGGASLAHMAFLPTDERPTAVVEIYTTHPDTIMRKDATGEAAARFSLQRSPNDPFVRLASALRVKSYTRVGAQLVAGASSSSIVVSAQAVVAGLQPFIAPGEGRMPSRMATADGSLSSVVEVEGSAVLSSRPPHLPARPRWSGRSTTRSLQNTRRHSRSATFVSHTCR